MCAMGLPAAGGELGEGGGVGEWWREGRGW
jgi:hypothetical protein